MPTEILMPALSPTMEEGTLAKWLVKEGDAVSSGDVMAEIETDKATMEFEAVDEGTIGKIIVPEGTEGVKVNDVIAILLEDGESADDIGETNAPAAKADAAEKPAEAAPADETPASPPAPAAPKKDGERIFASPLARRIAKDAGLDVTAGVSIHHLTLNSLDVGDYRTFFKVKPPLRDEDDRVAGRLRGATGQDHFPRGV